MLTNTTMSLRGAIKITPMLDQVQTDRCGQNPHNARPIIQSDEPPDSHDFSLWGRRLVHNPLQASSRRCGTKKTGGSGKENRQLKS